MLALSLILVPKKNFIIRRDLFMLKLVNVRGENSVQKKYIYNELI
jgi:hypothetical protein